MRHGRSAHVHSGWIDAAGFRAWREAYEAAGIREQERPPASLLSLLAQADMVVTSDAPRALASARLLAPAHAILVSPLLRELTLDGPRLGGLRLPLAAWAVAVGGQMLAARLRGEYPRAEESARVTEAFAWLESLASRRSFVVVVTHHSFRGQLARRLALGGWCHEPGSRTSRHWSAWLMGRPEHDPS